MKVISSFKRKLRKQINVVIIYYIVFATLFEKVLIFINDAKKVRSRSVFPFVTSDSPKS